MRSIRLQLIVYFLGLLVLALGVASLLVYRSARATLREKEEAAALLIEERFARQEAEERKQLDDRLLEKAFALAGRVELSVNWQRMRNRSVHSIGAVTAAAGPMGHLAAAPWLLQMQMPNQFAAPFAFEIWRRRVVRVSLNEVKVELPDGRRKLDDYTQIDVNGWGPPYRSVALAKLSFPDPAGFGGDERLHWEADNLEIATGHWVRRVRVKAANTKIITIPFWGRPAGPPRTGPRPFEPPSIHPTFQVATGLAAFDRTLADLRAERDEELANTRAETASALSRLRNNLLAIAGCTFLATVLGTCWLVWAGLWPLRKLGDAVSHVSPRDFSFPLTKEEMPSELRPITEKLTGTLDQLKRAFDREKQATADISHELRTPLAALLTTCELALRRERTPEKYREMFADCHASAKYLHQIVERLLSLARLDAGVDRCKPQPVDVARVAEECASVIRPLAEAKGLTLTVSNDGGQAGTATDPDKLREVMNNLLHNAIQYNRPDGRIDLTVSRENGHVRFEVADTGVGIPEASRGRIFERFYRADPSRNCGDGLHAGLGLAIVKEYIEVMGGHIEVSSREGEGTTFRIDLPVRA